MNTTVSPWSSGVSSLEGKTGNKNTKHLVITVIGRTMQEKKKVGGRKVCSRLARC